MDFHIQQAQPSHIPQIWGILQGAIEKRKEEGSRQWQDGYPNPEVIAQDIEKGVGYVLKSGGEIIAYTAVLINDEPEYANLKGEWLSNGDFIVFHRVAVSRRYAGQGYAQKMLLWVEQFARKHRIYSIKADTNFDNAAMLNLFEKLGYTYCGEVFFRGSPRKAFEKVLVKADGV